ncbi:MAG: hypothetical protein M3Y87_13760 [Myxococcota bacterium]|nr:hypothetical protein [Myxococcota bacterium]
MSRALVLVLAAVSIGCARDYPVPTLTELPPLEPDGVRAFRGELFVPTGDGVQRLDGDVLRTELGGLPGALETLHDTGERLWLSRRDISPDWGSPETVYERGDEGEWRELPLTGLLVSSAATAGDEAWIVSVEGLGSPEQRHHLFWWHAASLDELPIGGDHLRVFATSAGVYLTSRVYGGGTDLFAWDDDRFVRVAAPHGWSDDPLLTLAHGRLHAVVDHRLVDVLSGAAFPDPPPIQADDPRNAGVYYEGNETVLLIQDWVVDTGGWLGGASSHHEVQIDRFDDGWVPAARLQQILQSAFWLVDDTLVVCDSSACYRADGPAE